MSFFSLLLLHVETDTLQLTVTLHSACVVCGTIRISRKIEPMFPMKATEWCLAAK